MSTAARLVPPWIRVLTFLLALANVVFGVAGYLSTSVLFPDLGGTGLTAASPILIHACREFSARNLAIGLALLIVSRVGVPESIAIVTIIRALIEAQTLALGIAAGPGPALLVPLAFLALEVFIVQTLVAVIARRDAAAATPTAS
ncbi:MAG: hypothetical protein ABI193_20230 [Minicystis sp.]